MRLRSTLAGLAGLSLLAAAAPAGAVILGGYKVTLSDTKDYLPNPTSPSISDHNSFGDSAASITLSPALTAEVSGFRNSKYDLYAHQSAEAYMQFYFAILSGTPGPLHMLVFATAEAGGTGYYEADASVATYGGGPAWGVTAHACNAIVGCDYNNKYTAGGWTPVTWNANQAVEMVISASGRTGSLVPSTFQAKADPIIEFDPAYAHPADAHIVFSDNLPGLAIPGLTGEPGGVPEPAAWALLITGFAGVGGALRLQRAARRSAAAHLAG
jgi:hypothetical protein